MRNEGNGFFSCGWVFKPDLLFDVSRLTSLLTRIDVKRIKGGFLTRNEPVLYNMVDGELTQSCLDNALDSRIEIITQDAAIFKPFEIDLLNCTELRSG